MSQPYDPHLELQQLRISVEELRERISRLEHALHVSDRAVSTLPEPPFASIAPPSQSHEPPQPVGLTALSPPSAAQSTIRRSSSASLETIIGQNWASWIGGIVLFFGIVFFLKYAWDQGWIRPSPTARVAAAIVSGAILTCAGEWAHRKQIRTLAGSLCGVGVAVVIASFFAANVYFHPPVIGRNAAFACVAITAGLAILLAVHINAITLAMLALIGAYLSPFVLASRQDQSAFLLAYLGVLAFVGLILSFAKPRWIPLRWLVLVCTYLSVGSWWFNIGERNDHQTLLLWWSWIFYAGVVIESVLTLRRARDRNEETAIDSLTLHRRPLHVNLTLIGLLVTAATFGLLAVAVHPSQPLLGAFALALAATQIAAAMGAPSASYRIGAVLQAAALVTAAVPLMLDEFAITIAWVLLAIVLALLGRQLALPAVRGWAAILLILAAVRIFVFDQSNASLQAVILRVADQPLSRWMLLGWTIAALFHVIAWLKPKPNTPSLLIQRWRGIEERSSPPSNVLDYQQPRQEPTILDTAGVVLAIVGTLLFVEITFLRWNGPPVTLACIAWLTPIALLAPAGRHIGYGLHAAVFALLVSLRWLSLDNCGPLMQTWASGQSALPILNLPALCGLLLAGAVLLVCWDEKLLGTARLDSRTQLPIRNFAIAVACIILFALVNFEIWRMIDWLDERGISTLADRGIVKHVAMSVLWASIGFVAVMFGFRRCIAEIRWAALGLLGVTLAKILLVDMAEVKAIWRILSFVAVGLLLLAVSFVYHRQLSSNVQSQPME